MIEEKLGRIVKEIIDLRAQEDALYDKACDIFGKQTGYLEDYLSGFGTLTDLKHAHPDLFCDRVLLIGSTGYVGGKFKNYFKTIGKSIIIPHRVDLSIYENCENLLQEYCPDIVINCAGFTGKPNVDQCELPEIQPLCLDGNVKVPLNLANACLKFGVKLGHVSSGCIFEGTDWFNIFEEPNFTTNGSFYSLTKSVGETLIKNKNVYIWRLRIPFDQFASPRNYITKMLNYDKVFGAPNSLSHLGDFTEACWKSLEQEPKIFNMTNAGHLPFEEVVSILKEYQPKLSKNLKIVEFPELIAPRSNCTLEGDPLMRPVREAFVEAVQNYK